MTVTANQHLSFSYGCIDSFYFKTNDGISYGCNARTGTAYADSTPAIAPKTIALTKELQKIRIDGESNCMLVYIEFFQVDPCGSNDINQINLDITSVGG